MNIMAGSLGGHIPEIRSDGLSLLSLVLNNVCPLRCASCYLQADGPPTGLRPEEWLRFLRSVLGDLRPDAVCFSGKEVFALEESADVFFEAIRLRNALQTGASARTRIGVVTNGILLNRFGGHLLGCRPDWLDVSIDGLEQAHDAVRGGGAFAALARNIPWLLDILGHRLWVTLTLMESNIDALPEIVSTLSRDFGLKRFSIGLYQPQSFTSPQLRLPDAGRESRILRSLFGLSLVPGVEGVQVAIGFEPNDQKMRERLEREGLIPGKGVLRTSEREFENGLTLRIATATVPVGLWRAVRVTNEGFWLAAEDLVRSKEYAQLAVANIAEYGYDACRLREAGLAHPRFCELTGMSAAEFLAGLPVGVEGWEEVCA